MYVPSNAREVLRDPSPVQGDPAAIASAAKFVGDVSDDCVRYDVNVQAASMQLSSLKSEAVRAHRLKIETTLPRGSWELRESADGAKASFSAYASEVERIHQSARRAEQTVESRFSVIRSASATIEDILCRLRQRLALSWPLPPSGPMPMPVLDPVLSAGMDVDEQGRQRALIASLYEADWVRAVSQWRQACTDIEVQRRIWVSLQEERGNAEQQLVRSLRVTSIGQLITVGSVRGAHGPKSLIAHTLAGELWGDHASGIAMADLHRLLSGELSAEEVAQLWKMLEDDNSVDTDALLRAYCFELANLDGLPFSVMDTAGRAALDFALDARRPDQLREAFRRMGFCPGDCSLSEFRSDLEAVRNALKRADRLIPEGDVVQLVALGSHDGVATAGVSMGDLDDAATVGVFVSGMMSNVEGLPDTFEAFAKIRAGDMSMALVTWQGYRAPNLAEETFQYRADAGGTELAAFLDSIAVRRQSVPDAVNLKLIAHSYGTNVSAEALKVTQADVTGFVSLGSAGLKYGTVATDLKTKVYATQAEGDGWASLGRAAHFRFRSDGGGRYEARVDPAELEGARVFTSEKTPEGKAVTMHNLLHPVAWPEIPVPGVHESAKHAPQLFADTWDGTAAADEVGYMNSDSSTVSELKKIMRIRALRKG